MVGETIKRGIESFPLLPFSFPYEVKLFQTLRCGRGRGKGKLKKYTPLNTQINKYIYYPYTPIYINVYKYIILLNKKGEGNREGNRELFFYGTRTCK